MAHTTESILTHICRCERCGHRWETRLLPKRCAKCKSPYWNTRRGTRPRGRPRKS